jgi:polysaccharide export outer membrane protein
MAKVLFRRCVSVSIVCASLVASASAQTPAPPSTVKPTAPAPAPATPAVKPAAAVPAAAPIPPGYVIGIDDLLAVRFFGDTQLSADVVVRPDGKISLALLNDVQAAGFTPEQLGDVLEKAASKYINEPDATVIVREVRSRKVYVIGQVAKPSPVVLNTDMNVLQALTEVGGLLEYADKSNIVIVRPENGKERRFKFNYKEVTKGKNPQQNILLKPGDTILVN